MKNRSRSKLSGPEAKGELKGGIAIARELKKEGLALDFIAKTTKLPIGEI
ncbi:MULTISPECIES: hypothetical protein [Olivibacter]|uniref:Uncharacterized protein n=1 Tax=Olivibacter oleidegradans TaxID=760123 RepID=A0ABV6HII1_9SPHI|nr:hypothetical protein [Olivibacter jilunii]